MKLWIKILIALALGVVTGVVLGPYTAFLKPIGTAFLNLINMIVVLLVLASMTVGVTSIHDPKKLGRVGLKTLTAYFITTAIAIAIGISVVIALGIGGDMHLTPPVHAVAAVRPEFHISDILLSTIPTNPIASLVEGNVLQIIVFAIFLGIAINFAKDKGRPLLEVFESLSDVMYRLTSIIMEFSPIGVFAIMAWVSGNFGLSILFSLFKFLITFYAVCIAYTFLVLAPGLRLLTRLNPFPLLRGMSDAMMVAFSTSSSSATLPVSMHCVQENLGVSKNISSFVLPLGATINMNGTGIYQGMSALFVANAYGLDLGWQAIVAIMTTAIMSAVGAAGIPGTGFIMLPVVFNSAGIPIEGLALLAGIDRIREMGSTVLNILGDAVCAVYVAKTEGELDESQYYHEDLVEMDGGDV